MIGLIELDPQQIVRISPDDLAEMYYTFQVPEQRARKNCLRVKFSRVKFSAFHASTLNATRPIVMWRSVR